MKNKSPYYPTYISQNSNDSIVSENGIYDFKKISHQEEQVIFSVLNTVKRNFSPDYYSIGLVLESYGIVYKPRYILFELIVQKYKQSSEPIDRFAVGIAYSNKGAVYRKSAIEYIENSINDIPSDCFSLISNVYPLWGLYNLMSELCEKELLFEKAIEYAILSIKNKTHLVPYDYIHIGRIYLKIETNLCVKYYEAVINSNIPKSYKDTIRIELNDAKEKQQKGYKYKPRIRKQKDELEEDIKSATREYINYI